MMMMIFRKLFGFDLEEEKEEEIVQSEETPEDEETKFEMTITDEIACAAESKLFEMTKEQTETLNDHRISMDVLKQKFDELDELDDMKVQAAG